MSSLLTAGPRGDSSCHASPLNDSILAPSRLQVPGGSPAFMQRLSRYSVLSQFHSTGTWGRKRPLYPMKSMMRPSLPMTIFDSRSAGESNTIGSGGVRTVTSTVTPPSSLPRRSGNLGSWQAEHAARSIAWPSGITGSGIPMQPRRSPPG